MKKIMTCLALSGAFISAEAWAYCALQENTQATKPDGLYIDNLDGTVTDKGTGLTWAKCAYGQAWVGNNPDDGSDDVCNGTASTYKWNEALEAVGVANDSNYLGATDWRAPNVKELESLLERACFVEPDRSINTNLFPVPDNSYPTTYWTSTPRAGHDDYAWHVNFSAKSSVFYLGKRHDANLRLVRDGQ